MKVGDLIKWENTLNDDMDRYAAHYGVIIKMSRTGHDTESAEILWVGGDTGWYDTKVLEVVSEGR
jgi:S-formylglutathione hydrolase FrmB